MNRLIRAALSLLVGLALLTAAPGCIRAGFEGAGRDAATPGDVISSDSAFDRGAPPHDATTPDLPDPISFAAATPLTQFNTSSDDDDPTLTADQLVLCFNSSQQILCTQRSDVDAPWDQPAQPIELGGLGVDSAPELSADGLLLRFASTRIDALSQGGRDLYEARRPSRSDGWDTPVNLEILNTSSDESTSTATADELLIIFSSSRSGSQDLYLSTRTSTTAPWSPPAALAINSAASDGAPWISANGDVLYFASDRAGGAGGVDIWFSYRSPSAAVAFEPPQLLEGISTSADENDPWLTADRRTIYFNRDGDLYRATR